MTLLAWLFWPLFDQLKKELTMNQQELLDRLGAVEAAVDKIGGETTALVSEVATLKEALANAGVTSPEVDAAVAAIEERVKAVDDLVPDAAPPVEPTP